MARSPRRGSVLHRLLGGPDSWRRILLAGGIAGVVLALAVAMIAALVTGSGSGSLDEPAPTAIVSGGQPADGGGVDAPPQDDRPEPTQAPLPTEPPIAPMPTEPPPTAPPLIPTATSVPKEPPAPTATPE